MTRSLPYFLKIFMFAQLMLLLLGAMAVNASESRDKNIIDVAISAGDFNTLAIALQAGGLIETLAGEGPFTVFAPTDDAFAKLPPGALESLLEPSNRNELVALLTSHVVAGSVSASAVAKVTEATTVNGGTLVVRSDAGELFVGNARVIAADIPATNGVIHVVDAVIIP